MSEPLGVPATPTQCQVHRRHSPKPLIIVKHHIQPRGMGGSDDPGNWLYVCDTGHRNIHTLMGPLANGMPMPRGGTSKERDYALLGYQRWVQAGRPGSAHAAYAFVHHGEAPGPIDT